MTQKAKHGAQTMPPPVWGFVRFHLLALKRGGVFVFAQPLCLCAKVWLACVTRKDGSAMVGHLRGKRCGRGFTLIELLVVIAIIALLAAILFPVFAQAREKAREGVCSSNVRQIAMAVRMYVGDYDETFPIFYAYHTQPPSGVAGHKGIEMLLQPYTKSHDVFRCPDDTGGPVPQNSPSSEYGCKDYPAKSGSYYDCYGSSYRFTSGTYSIVAGESNQNNDTTQFTQDKIVTDAQFVRPAETRIMRDEMFPWFGPQADPGGAKYGYVPDYYRPWHTRGGGFVFADGHAKFHVSSRDFDTMFVSPDANYHFGTNPANPWQYD